jgi:hypothetical protein
MAQSAVAEEGDPILVDVVHPRYLTMCNEETAGVCYEGDICSWDSGDFDLGYGEYQANAGGCYSGGYWYSGDYYEDGYGVFDCADAGPPQFGDIVMVQESFYLDGDSDWDAVGSWIYDDGDDEWVEANDSVDTTPDIIFFNEYRSSGGEGGGGYAPDYWDYVFSGYVSVIKLRRWRYQSGWHCDIALIFTGGYAYVL